MFAPTEANACSSSEFSDPGWMARDVVNELYAYILSPGTVYLYTIGVAEHTNKEDAAGDVIRNKNSAGVS